jgi:hypothetical protein
MYCQDVGTYIWKCIRKECGILVCVAKAQGDHGCIDATPDELTNVVDVDANTFVCPQCLRASGMPMPVRDLFFLHLIVKLILTDNSTRFADIQFDRNLLSVITFPSSAYSCHGTAMGESSPQILSGAHYRSTSIVSQVG